MTDCKVNICGVPHTVIHKEDSFCSDASHFGEINYKKAEIYISTGMTPEMEEQTLIHEMMHGILLGIGRNDLCNDETLVQSLAQAIQGCFEVKRI